MRAISFPRGHLTRHSWYIVDLHLATILPPPDIHSQRNTTATNIYGKVKCGMWVFKATRRIESAPHSTPTSKVSVLRSSSRITICIWRTSPLFVYVHFIPCTRRGPHGTSRDLRVASCAHAMHSINIYFRTGMSMIFALLPASGWRANTYTKRIGLWALCFLVSTWLVYVNDRVLCTNIAFAVRWIAYTFPRRTSSLFLGRCVCVYVLLLLLRT